MGTVTKVEPEPSDGIETVTTLMDSNDEFILPTLEPPAPRQVRLTALKERQKLEINTTNMSEIVLAQSDIVKSLQIKTEVEDDVITSELTEQLEDVTVSGCKMEPSLKTTEYFFEGSLSSGCGDVGMDHDGPGSPESEPESGTNEEESTDAKKKVRTQPKIVHVPENLKAADIKFTCNYESCVRKQLIFPFPRDVRVHLVEVHGGDGVNRLYHCVHCSHRSPDMEKLRRHYLVHKELQLRTRHSCATCGKEFLNLYHMKKHQANCSKRPAPLKCKFCRKPFPTVELLSAHLALHSAAQSPFDCVLCAAKLKSRPILISHVKNVHEGLRPPSKQKKVFRSFPCNFPVCLQNGSKFNGHEDMKRHLADDHGQPDFAQELIYHCIQCVSRFKLNANLQRHLAADHGAIKEVTKDDLCSICGKLFSSMANLRNHLRDFHTELQMKPKCCHCTKSCDSPEDLQAHEQLHSSQTPYACVLCPETLFTTMDLHSHVYNTHELVPFKCQEEGCGKGFERKVRLDWHMKATHGPGLSERPHKCPHCPFSAWTASSLQYHAISHTQEKRYICDVEGCGHRFFWKAQLSKHVRMRHEEPVTTFTCKTCGKGFRTMGQMKRHEAHHSDIRRFACHVCSARFKVPSNLKQHMQCHERGGTVKGDRSRPRKPRLV